MDRTIPSARVEANPLTVPEPLQNRTTAAIRVVTLPSMMADKATEDRQVVETNLKNGQDLDQATASFTVMNTLNNGIKKQKRNYKHMKINRRLSL